MKSLNGVAVAALIAAVTAPAAFAQEAVQWRVEDGGNGHWYQVKLAGFPIRWQDCRISAEAAGGYLATLVNIAEHEWVGQLAASFPDAWSPGLGFGPVLGAAQLVPNSGPTADWHWITGEPWDFTAWAGGEPNDHEFCAIGGDEPYLAFLSPTAWNDVQDTTNCYYGWLVPSYVIEWSADCNGDGLVDYGQILDGTFEDANENGVPDLCECDADINDDGVVNGADISVLLGYWGQSGKNVVGDITGDGIVNGADLAQLLGSWGECP